MAFAPRNGIKVVNAPIQIREKIPIQLLRLSAEKIQVLKPSAYYLVVLLREYRTSIRVWKMGMVDEIGRPILT